MLRLPNRCGPSGAATTILAALSVTLALTSGAGAFESSAGRNFCSTRCRQIVPRASLRLLPRNPPSLAPKSLRVTQKFDGASDDGVDRAFLQAELSEYLEKRRQVDADKLAKQDVGKQVGGTRGNAWLDYVSLAPNKGSVITEAPNMFDYSELERYGYSHLATPIMKAGGRLAMYDLMGLDRPALPSKAKPRAPEPIVLDRTGQNDAARYSGLKLGQVLDDNVQATVLAEAERKAREGQRLRPKLVEEDYERPFADVKSKTSPSNPYWTAERLDEWGKMRGKVIADAQRAKADQLVADRMETLDLELPLRLYAVLTGLLASAAFGRATPTFLTQVLNIPPGDVEVLDVVRVPVAALLLACLGSSVFCATQASQKKRNAFVWSIRGLLGGPMAIAHLKDLPALVTRRELEAQRQD